jgi:DNA-binding response OmpR family regulator
MMDLKSMSTMMLNWHYLLSSQITTIYSSWILKCQRLDGYELYTNIRKKDNKVKVCFLTASEKYKEEHRPSFPSSDSTDCFLIKPIAIDDLVKK